MLRDGIRHPLFRVVFFALLLAFTPLLFGSYLSAHAAQVTMTIDAKRTVRPVPPGVIGWGAMWKRKMLWPTPPEIKTDAQHAAYIDKLGGALAPIIEQGDVRHLSWPWGVSFSTWGVNWENSAKPWSRRPSDCARIAILNKGSGWCERTIVGVGDLMNLAQRWRLEAITVAVPLAVIDGKRVRWGPGFFDQTFSPDVIEKISDHARRLVDYMKRQPGWRRLKRIYISAGCEWRHYKQRNPSPAVLTYAALIKRVRQRIPEKKVVIVASASDSADIPGIKARQAKSWNKYLYRELKDVRGVALDLHRYRGMIGLSPGPGNTTPMSVDNAKKLLRTGVTQRRYLTVAPHQWGENGPAMPTVLLENAIHGHDGDHSRQSNEPWPWPAVMAHGDLVREALASPALTFLGWTFFPETLPPEWPHGALKNGKLQPHAKVQAFLSRGHRGRLLHSKISDEAAVRGNATQSHGGQITAYGGNFGGQPQKLRIVLRGARQKMARLKLMTLSGTQMRKISLSEPFELPPLSFWRVTIASR